MQNQELEVKVSIVMPVLNTIRYVRECMDSLIHQTLKEIEILCVDANSTDGTREILQEYADRDSRVHIYTKEAQGMRIILACAMPEGNIWQ